MADIFTCSTCGKQHGNEARDIGFSKPFYWNKELEKSNPDLNRLSSDTCVIEGKEFFIRGVVEIPIVETNETFRWGVWVSLSKENFNRYTEIYGTSVEFQKKSYFGWFSNQLSRYGYPDTLQIKTAVYPQANNLRPKIVLDPENSHPLCREQREGITLKRIHEILAATE